MNFCCSQQKAYDKSAGILEIVQMMAKDGLSKDEILTHLLKDGYTLKRAQAAIEKAYVVVN